MRIIGAMMRRQVVCLAPLLLSAALYRCVGTNPDLPGEDADTAADGTVDVDADADAAALDAVTLDADVTDSMDAGPPVRCDPMGRFTTVQPVAGVNTLNRERSVHLTDDELTIFFSRANLLGDGGAPPIGSFDIYKATRPSRTDPFGPTQLVTALNSGGSDQALSLDPAGGVAYFIREADRHVFPDGGANPNHGVYVARVSTLQGFTDVSRSTINFQSNFLGGVSAGQVSRDIYYASHQHIFLLSWDSTNNVFRPARLLEPIADASVINQPYTGLRGYQGAPMLSRDETALYFTRTDPTNGVHVAFKGASQAFSSVRRLTEIEPVGVNNSGPWISADQCRLYFSSDRTGNDDLYVATRAPL